MPSLRVKTGFWPRNTLAMKSGAKLLRTGHLGTGACHVAGPSVAGDHQGTTDRCPMLRLDCGFTPAGGLIVVAQREVRHCNHKAGQSDPSTPVVPRAQSQRELSVHFRLLAPARGRLSKCRPDEAKCVVRIELVSTSQASKATAIFRHELRGPSRVP